MTQGQDLALGPAEPHTIGLSPSIQPVQISLQNLPAFQQVDAPTQLSVICKTTEGTLDNLIQIVCKDIKQLTVVKDTVESLWVRIKAQTNNADAIMGVYYSQDNVCGILMQFNKTKCKQLPLGQHNPQERSRLGDEQTESSPAEKELGVLVGERLDMTRSCELTAQKAKHVLGCIQSRVGSRSREGILPLCSGETPPVMLHPALGSQHRKDINLE
ncbi:hypothetical protein BTVI_37785 [Pitangus sulphuratus]|nr:hypothetical protein BTVI_37785 [Pitangus sulphuratus]